MTIKGRLTVMSVVMVVMGGILVGMQYGMDQLQHEADQAEQLVADIKVDMLLIRQHEKDFLLQRDLEYSNQFERQYRDLRSDLATLDRSLLQIGYPTAQIAELRDSMGDYQQRFTSLVTLHQRAGLQYDEGAQGELQRLAEKIEAEISPKEGQRLREALLKLRSHEKDFLLRFDLSARDQLVATLDQLDWILVGYPQQKKRVLEALFSSYRAAFFRLVAARLQAGVENNLGLQGELAGLAQSVEMQVEKLISGLSQFLQRDYESMRQLRFAALSVMVLIMVLWVMLVSSRIGRETRRLVGEIRELGESKNLSRRILSPSSDELGFVAHSINHMLDQAAETRAELNRSNQAREAVEELSFAKDQFLASMSHELRTPLTAIIGNSDYLLDATVCGNCEGSSALGVIRSIKSAGESQLALVNDILDTSKIESGKFSIEEHPYNLAVLLEHVGSMLKVRAIDSGVHLAIEQRNQEAFELLGDRQRIEQILINLIGNAIKFTPAPGKVTLTTWVEREQLNFKVEDTGIGMAPGAMDHLFKRFEQADGTISRRFGGSGLGLFISINLAELMGGTIDVASQEGQGSAFTLMLPYRRSEVSIVQQNEAPADSLQLRHYRGRVLIAEDVPMLQQLASRMVERVGATVSIAENGLKAVEQLGEQSYDLVLMDMQMPEMDGLEATRKIRAAGNRVPIVACTANVMEQQREAFREAGCDDFLAKPFEQKDLLAFLERYLEVV